MYNKVDVAAILLLALASTSLVLSMPVFKHKTEKLDKEKAEEREIFFDPTADTDFTVKVGDMTLFSDSYLDMLDETSKDTSKRHKRTVVNLQSQIWPQCTLPYILDSTYYTESQRRVVLQAMAHWEEHTCVRFRERTDERDYIYIYPGPGCSSFVGRTSRQQRVSIGPSCFSFPAALHELGHAIGFYHEHNRPDRDEHVDILEENLLRAFGVRSQFEKLAAHRVNLFGMGYDYNSVMHYDKDFFARRFSLNTIVAHDPSIPVGLATELSKMDILRANMLCGCSNSTKDHPPRLVVVPEEKSNDGNDVEPIPPRKFECGEVFDGVESGTISSPNYGVYSHNADCDWTIRVREGYQIRLSVDIDMDYTSGCPNDYLEIYESLDRSGYRLGKWCYRDYQFPTYTITNTAHIRFHTDGSNQRSRLRGFRIRFEAEDFNECQFGYCSHGCTNLPGSYKCSCPEGFYLSGDNKQCFDVNECALNKGGCDHKCVNKGGHFHCACNEGYVLLSDGKTCVINGSGLVDPCEQTKCERECKVVKQSMTAQCLCPKRYTLSSDGISCADVNECLINKGGCQGLCTNTEGSYECGCKLGSRLMEDGRTCEVIQTVDINLPEPIIAPEPIIIVEVPTQSQTIPPTTAKPTTPPTTAKPTTPPTTAKPTTPPTTAKPTTSPTTAKPTTPPKPTTPTPTVPPLPRTGHVQSPNWPATYPVNVDMQWVIECPPSTTRISISLNNQPFWLGGQQHWGCPKDWVTVYGSATKSGRQFGPYCSNVPPTDFEVTSDRALVVFHAGPKHHPSRTGFRLTYVCIP